MLHLGLFRHYVPVANQSPSISPRPHHIYQERLNETVKIKHLPSVMRKKTPPLVQYDKNIMII